MHLLRRVAALLTALAASLALAACGLSFPDPKADFQNDLESLGYDVVGSVNQEVDGEMTILEARVAISDSSNPDCYIEFERVYVTDLAAETVKVNGIEMRPFELDEVENETATAAKAGKELDLEIELESPSLDKTLEFLEGSGKVGFCLAA